MSLHVYKPLPLGLRAHFEGQGSEKQAIKEGFTDSVACDGRGATCYGSLEPEALRPQAGV